LGLTKFWGRVNHGRPSTIHFISQMNDFLATTRPITNESLTTKVTQLLEQAILTGQIKPGEKLVERELSERLGISRSPIREAIRSLQSSGLVKIIPWKGTIVSEVSKREVEEIYAVKSMLESFAAGVACKRITHKQVRRFRALLAKMEKEISKNNLYAYLKLSQEFHELFIKASDNTKLYEIYQSLSKQIQWLQLISLSFSDRAKHSLREHKQIMEAFVERKPELVEQLVRDHVDRGGKALVQKLELNNDVELT